MAYIEATIGNYDNAISLFKERLKLTAHDDHINLFGTSYNILGMYCLRQKFEEGLIYSEEIEKMYPEWQGFNSALIGFYYKFLIYEHTGNKDKATLMLQEINKRGGSNILYNERVDDANRVRFFTEIEKGNYEAAKVCLKKTTLDKKFYLKKISNSKKAPLSNLAKLPSKESNELPYDEELEIAKIEAEISINSNKRDAKIVVKATSTHEEKKPQDSQDKAQEVAENYEDPRAFHAYCTRYKAQLIKKSLEKSFVKSQVKPSWIYKEQEIIQTQDESNNVYKVGASENYYVHVPDKIAKILIAKGLQKQFIEAITQKGMVARAEGQAGIKYCNGFAKGLAEIKIMVEERIWSNLTLCNDKGQYVIMINHEGNHDAFKKAAEKGKMTVINVSSNSLDANNSKNHKVKLESKEESDDEGDADDEDLSSLVKKLNLYTEDSATPDSEVAPTGDLLIHTLPGETG